MSTLTNNNNFTIAAGPTAQVTTDVLVLPVAAPGQGTGRIIHPTLGTYDYPFSPDEWVNLDSDVIIPPVWQSSKTLGGGINTLWAGKVQDVICIERWTSAISMPLAMLRQLINLWVTPPDPSADYVLWYPSYSTALGFKVVITSLTVGGQEVTLNFVSRQAQVAGVVELKMRIVGYAP